MVQDSHCIRIQTASMVCKHYKLLQSKEEKVSGEGIELATAKRDLENSRVKKEAIKGLVE